jgi:RND family efflux transporter MFP subunit
LILFGVMAVAPSACEAEPISDAPVIRPVRTTTVEITKSGAPQTFTGRIESTDEAALGFRIGGRMIERKVGVGDRVEAGQLLARLEPQNEVNALRSEQANLAAAQARLTEARNRFERLETLLGQGWTTRALYDQAEKELRTAEAQVDSAEARLQAAHDLVSFTELEADAPGIVTETGAQSGEVVQAGQMILRLARQDGRDAVFDIPAQVLRSVPADSEIKVQLASSGLVSTTDSATHSGSSTDSPHPASPFASFETTSKISAPNFCTFPMSRRSRFLVRKTSGFSSNFP